MGIPMPASHDPQEQPTSASRPAEGAARRLVPALVGVLLLAIALPYLVSAQDSADVLVDLNSCTFYKFYKGFISPLDRPMYVQGGYHEIWAGYDPLHDVTQYAVYVDGECV